MAETKRPVVERRREGVGGLAIGLLAALALHLALLPLLPGLLQGAPRARKAGAAFVSLSRAQFEKNRRVEVKLEEAKPPDGPADEKKKKDDDEADAPGRVVALPPPDKEERPDFADHASEWNQKVARETVSRDQRPAENLARRLIEGARGGQTSAPNTQSAPSADGESSSGPLGRGRATSGDSGTDPESGAGQRMFVLEVPRQAAREPLQLRMDVNGIMHNRTAVPELPGNGDTARIAMGNTPADMAHRSGAGGEGRSGGQGMVGGGNGTAGPPSLAELTPSPQDLVKLSGAPATDWLPDVEVDAETALNAWRWKHATFFNRIADRIRREWQGGQVLSHDDPGGNVYGFEDRMTVVQVTLDRSGNVLDVNVAEPSGAVALDDEAVRAFKQAGPFSNPPPQLFKGQDRFSFMFGFNVSYNRTNFDLHWRPD